MSTEQEKWDAASHALGVVKDKLIKCQLDLIKICAERDNLKKLVEKETKVNVKLGIELLQVRKDYLKNDPLLDYKAHTERKNKQLRAQLQEAVSFLETLRCGGKCDEHSECVLYWKLRGGK